MLTVNLKKFYNDVNIKLINVNVSEKTKAG